MLAEAAAHPSLLRRSLRRHTGTVVLHALLAAGGLVMAYPFVYGLLASFCTVPDFEQSLLVPLPVHFSLANVRWLLAYPHIWIWMRNSAIRCLWFALVPTWLSLTS